MLRRSRMCHSFCLLPMISAIFQSVGAAYGEYQHIDRAIEHTSAKSSRVARAAPNLCDPESSSKVSTAHKTEVEALIKAMNTKDGEFTNVLDENGEGPARTYTYVCTLGKGNAEAVVFRVNVAMAGKASYLAALKVSFGKTAKLLNNEAMFMLVARRDGPNDFVPETSFYGWSRNKDKVYYLLEMPDVGKTLDNVLKNGLLSDPAKWKEYFVSIMGMIKALHNADLEKCFVHGDVHLGNVVLDDKGKLYLIDWGKAKLCRRLDKDEATQMEPTSMQRAVKGDLVQFAKVLMTCASKLGRISRTFFGSCEYGSKLNAGVYSEAAGEKFKSFHSAYWHKNEDQYESSWKRMLEIQAELATHVEDK